MGQQLGTNESYKIITDAIKATGENFDSDFYLNYSTIRQDGFYLEIADKNILKKISALSKEYEDSDYTFSLTIPYEYFNDDQLPEDTALGLDAITHTEVKIELRCMYLIAKTHEKWINDHKLFTNKDLLKIINEAIDKLKKLKKLDLYFHGYENIITEKWVSVFLTEHHTPIIDTFDVTNFFKADLYVQDYYAPVGKHWVDSLIGKSTLRGKGKKEICLLRVTYIIYSSCINWLKQYWPDVYNKYAGGNL